MVTTFLPYPEFQRSAAILDAKRRNQQCNEVEWILKALATKEGRVYNHPASKMWEGFPDALVAYGLAMCGSKPTARRSRILAYRTVDYEPTQQNVPMPPWLGRESLHASHRGNLLRKDAEYYGSFGWTDSPLLPYEWPRN